MLDYLEDRVSEETASQIEEHLTGCQQCKDLGRQISEIAALVDGVTARSHGEAILALAVNNALESAAQNMANRKWAQRLEQWRKRFGGKALGAARFVMNETRQAALIFEKGLPTLLVPRALEFVSASRATEDVKVLELLGRPETRIAVEEEIDSRGKKIVNLTVSLGPEFLGPEPLLVMLINSRQPENNRILEPQQGSKGLIAVFRDLEPGEYVVILEPHKQEAE